MATNTSHMSIAASQGEEEDEDGRMDVGFIQGFAAQVQKAPAGFDDDLELLRPKILIPKRGEKDFEPLQETANLQEMMLQSSRQALFEALQGVRGVAGKALSHAIITPSSPFPRLLISRGHVNDSMGITVRRDATEVEKQVSSIELLPEETLYLVERGSLQVWRIQDTEDDTSIASELGKWSETQFGPFGGVEMSVMEVFGAFMGAEALTWERYQAYAYLKRLGYTVQRARQFLPTHFLQDTAPSLAGVLEQTIGNRLRALLRDTILTTTQIISHVANRALHLLVPSLHDITIGTALSKWHGFSYASMFKRLQFVGSIESRPRPAPIPQITTESPYLALDSNPYLPFFNVWKPATPWSKSSWDRGSALGLAQQPPDYIVAVVQSRDTPLPTLKQLDSIFELLPPAPDGPPQRIGPQYEKRQSHFKPRPPIADARPWWHRLILPSSGATSRPSNAVASLRNGDRALVVAVNDSGNTGWIRIARTNFGRYTMV